MTVNTNSTFESYAEIPSGSKIGNRYLIQTILGQGGLGRTYLAFDSYRFNEPCVLKEFAPICTEADQFQKSRDLFEREGRILYQLQHPQIPQFYACFQVENRLFLVQEYVKGRSYYQLLQQRLQQGHTFTETEIISLLTDLLPVLDYIHDRQIVHRDISPDNIMQLYGQTLPFLIDFGVGKQSVSEGSNQTNDLRAKRTFVGKIGYAPQEQMHLGRCYPSSDLYSLAVTAIVLLTGKTPNLLLDQHSLEWQWRSYTQVSHSFARIIDRMLTYNPKSRYQSAKEVIIAVQQLQEVKPVNFQETAIINEIPTNSAPQPEKSIQPTEEKTVNQGDNYWEKQPTHPQTSSLNPELVKYYQKQLAYYIGPIASIIVEEKLANNSFSSSRQLAEALAEVIPDEQQRRKFKQQLL